MHPFIRPGGYSSPFLLHIHDTALFYCEALRADKKQEAQKTAWLGGTDHN